MALRNHLLRRKEALARIWFERVLSAYPRAAAELLSRNTTSFSNPFAQNVLPALEAILEGVAGEATPAEVRPHLDAIVRIRAVQDFRPGAALAFLIQLKDLIREEADAVARSGKSDGRNGNGPIGDARRDSGLSGTDTRELRRIDERIDGALLMAFDLYTACREQVHSLRSDQRARALEMATPGRPSRSSRGSDKRDAVTGDENQHRN
jgi:hypothetical protein